MLSFQYHGSLSLDSTHVNGTDFFDKNGETRDKIIDFFSFVLGKQIMEWKAKTYNCFQR